MSSTTTPGMRSQHTVHRRPSTRANAKRAEHSYTQHGVASSCINPYPQMSVTPGPPSKPSRVCMTIFSGPHRIPLIAKTGGAICYAKNACSHGRGTSPIATPRPRLPRTTSGRYRWKTSAKFHREKAGPTSHALSPSDALDSSSPIIAIYI